jgi:hypothetical protein
MARASATWRGEREVILSFPYDPELIEALKVDIPGWARTYDPQGRTWTITSKAWANAAVLLLKEHYPNAAIAHDELPPPQPPPRADPPRWCFAGQDRHYATLHLLPTAPRQVVEAAYRALAKLHHPDLAPLAERESATGVMKAVNEAYRALTNEEARR